MIKSTTLITTFLLAVSVLFTSVTLASHQLRFTNNCSFTLWPTQTGTALSNSTSNGSSSSGKTPPQPQPPLMVSTVFGLASKRASTVQLSDGWFGRITATRERLPLPMGSGKNGSGEIDLKNHPLTTVEVKLDSDGGLDFYHLTLEHGFNVPVSFGPLAGTFDGRRLGNALCREVACSVDIAAGGHCPQELAVRELSAVNSVGGEQSSGKGSSPLSAPIGCQSACAAFGGDQFCCRGPFDRLDRCRSSEWKVDYPSAVFKAYCPLAYSYKYDDSQSTFICQSNANGKVGYGLTFCP